MDEYLFLTMAKLKADRVKLEREQREEARREAMLPRPVTDSREVQPAPVLRPLLLSWR